MEVTTVGVTEAARSLGIRLEGVYRLIYGGRLNATKVDGKWRVSAQDVENRIRRKGEMHVGTAQIA